MASLPDDGDMQAPHAPLGTLLVRRGLLTEDQLAIALAEQAGSGRPLGETLIALGFASPTTVAQALATQQGHLLKTEYGYATGFDAPDAVGSGAQQPPFEPTPAVAQAAVATVYAEQPAAPEAALFEAPAAPEAERDAARSEAAAAWVRVAELEAELEAQSTKLEGEWERHVSELQRRLDDAFAQLEAARATRPEPVSLSVDVEAFTGRVAELEEALVVEVALKDELESAVAERDGRIRQLEELVREQPWASSDRHLLFFRGPSGYALVEQEGPPPLPGARIEVAGAEGPQVVTRVAPAPLPGRALPCAYLVAA